MSGHPFFPSEWEKSREESRHVSDARASVAKMDTFFPKFLSSLSKGVSLPLSLSLPPIGLYNYSLPPTVKGKKEKREESWRDL